MTRTKTAQLNILQILFYGISGIFVLSAVLYIFFISLTVENIVARKSFEGRIVKTTMHIGELESTYMELRTGITPLLAESLGFNETENVVFAMRGMSAGLAKLGE